MTHTSRIILVLALLLTSVATAAQPLQIGSAKQLFVGPWAEDGRDEHLVASMKNVTMTTNEARVTGIRLNELDRPWEGDFLMDMSYSVIKDGDRFRMYYGAFPKHPKLWEEPNCRILCYAESTDGIHWEKPNLGLCTWDGSKQNNIIIPNDEFAFVQSEFAGSTVMIDPHPDSPTEKYKMLLKMTPVSKAWKVEGTMLSKGQYMFVSPDGIHWKLRAPKKINPGASDSEFSMFWDDTIGKYAVYTRIKRRWKDYYPFRMVGGMTTDDFRSFSKEQPVIFCDEMDMVGSPASRPRVDIY